MRQPTELLNYSPRSCESLLVIKSSSLCSSSSAALWGQERGCCGRRQAPQGLERCGGGGGRGRGWHREEGGQGRQKKKNTPMIFIVSFVCICVYLCVCVCVRERERERDITSSGMRAKEKESRESVRYTDSQKKKILERFCAGASGRLVCSSLCARP